MPWILKHCQHSGWKGSQPMVNPALMFGRRVIVLLCVARWGIYPCCATTLDCARCGGRGVATPCTG